MRAITIEKPITHKLYIAVCVVGDGHKTAAVLADTAHRTAALITGFTVKEINIAAVQVDVLRRGLRGKELCPDDNGRAALICREGKGAEAEPMGAALTQHAEECVSVGGVLPPAP